MRAARRGLEKTGIIQTMLTYHCSTCNRHLPREAFGNDRQKMDGRRRYCRECDRERRRTHWHNNLDRMHATQKAQRLTLPETIAERKRQYQATEAGREKMLARSREYSKTDRGREIKRKNQKKYARTEQGRIKGRLRNIRRRALLMGAGGTFTDADWTATLTRQEHRCLYCNQAFSETTPATIDHVIPLSRGGSHDASNIVAACKPCNSRKWNHLDAHNFAAHGNCSNSTDSLTNT